MVSPPVVSVVIPTYNQAALLEETLATVFAQTFRDYNIVVVNDGSTDDTADRLDRLQATHPEGHRLRIINQANAGIGIARNCGIDESNGQYVALLDHDDLWMPTKLATQVQFMQSHPDFVGCGVPYAYSTKPGQCAFELDRMRDAENRVERPLRKLAEGHIFVASSSMLFDRRKAEGVRYATVRGCIEDVPFMIRLFGRGPFGIAGDEILMIYRWHPENFSANASWFSCGSRLLRDLDRAGHFADLDGDDYADAKAMMAFVGRNAATRDAMAGYRLRGARRYCQEFSHQARLHRWRFLLSYPAMLLAPASVIRRHFPGHVR